MNIYKSQHRCSFKVMSHDVVYNILGNGKCHRCYHLTILYVVWRRLARIQMSYAMSYGVIAMLYDMILFSGLHPNVTCDVMLCHDDITMMSYDIPGQDSNVACDVIWRVWFITLVQIGRQERNFILTSG